MQKYTDVVQNRLGLVVEGAKVLVTDINGSVATIFSNNGTTQQANPMTTDANGRFAFYAADGRYNLTITINNVQYGEQRDILLNDPADPSPEKIDGGVIVNSQVNGSEVNDCAITGGTAQQVTVNGSTISQSELEDVTIDGLPPMTVGGQEHHELVEDVQQLTAQSRESLRRSYADAGYNLVDGSFEEGGVLTSTDDVMITASGDGYSWAGTYPVGGYSVAPDTDPTAVGSGYMPRTDVVLRVELTDYGVADFSHASTYAVGTLGSKFQKIVYPTDAPFNAVPDWTGGSTGTDNYTAFQAWMDYLCESGALGGIVGKFRVSQTIEKKAAYGAKCPNIIGAGADYAAICGPAASSAFRVQGGSGALAQAVISGLTFESVDGTGYGTEPSDIGGIVFRDCKFGSLAVGAMPHNKTSGGFTEYCVWENCEFTANCKQAIVYRRTGGNDSFHGTGLRDCQVNESPTETLPKVEIGGALSTNQDIILYNAPMSFQCWKQTSTAVIRNNSSRPVCNAYGVVTFETFGGNQFEIVASTKWNAAAGQQLYHVGGVVDFNNVAKLGLLRQMQNLAVLSNGTVRGLRNPYVVPVATMAAGAVANTITALPFVDGELFQVVIDMKSSASPCSKVFVLQCYKYSVASFVTQLSKPVAYFDGDLGDPVFSMSGNNLIATGAGNWPANTVTISATVTQLSGSRSAKI